MSELIKAMRHLKDRQADPSVETRDRATAEVHEFPRKPGRPKGKRSNPNFEQTTVYIPVQTHVAVTQILRAKRPRQDFSELIAELLEQYLEARI